MADPFDNIRRKSGLEIWRIENFSPVLVLDADHGNFYNQDCYVILKTTGNGLYPNYNVHFWLGSQASKDKIGAAAMYAQHLYGKVGAALQYRELQNEESTKFKSYFQNINYLAGGTDSGFRKNKLRDENIIDKKLYKIIQETDWKRDKIEFDLKSIQEKGIYILDTHLKIYIYVNDPTCSTFARTKARVLANEIKITKYNSEMIILDETSSPVDKNVFFQEFRYKYVILDEKSQQKEGQIENKSVQRKKLWKIFRICAILLVILSIFFILKSVGFSLYLEDWIQNFIDIAETYLGKIKKYMDS